MVFHAEYVSQFLAFRARQFSLLTLQAGVLEAIDEDQPFAYSGAAVLHVGPSFDVVLAGFGFARCKGLHHLAVAVAGTVGK